MEGIIFMILGYVLFGLGCAQMLCSVLFDADEYDTVGITWGLIGFVFFIIGMILI